jgi:hypothetical protein
MGIRSVLTGLFRGGVRPRFRKTESPGTHRYPLEAIEAALVELARVGEGWWCTIEAGEQRHAVQVAADQVNTLQEAIDLAGISRSLGMSALADAMPDTGDPTLHRVPTASPGEVGALVHAAYTTHFGLEDPYGVRCLLEC